jgi:ribosome-binding factor A
LVKQKLSCIKKKYIGLGFPQPLLFNKIFKLENGELIPMKSGRMLRLAELIQREIANIMVHHFIDEPLLRNVTVTAVKVAPDLATARIFVSVFDETKSKEVIALLKKQAKTIRHLLARGINLRVTPELHFVYDAALIHGEKLHSLIDQAIAKDQQLHKETQTSQKQQSADADEGDDAN